MVSLITIYSPEKLMGVPVTFFVYILGHCFGVGQSVMVGYGTSPL